MGSMEQVNSEITELSSALAPVESMEQVHSEASEPSSALPSQTLTAAKRPSLRRTIRKMDKRVREYRHVLCNWSNDAHGWLDNCQIRVDQLHLVMKLHESWARLVGLPTTFGEGLAAAAWAHDHGLPTLFGDAMAGSAADAGPEPGCLCANGSPEGGEGWCPWCLPYGTRSCSASLPCCVRASGGGVPGVSH